MKFLLTLLTVLTFGYSWSQSADDYVKSIEKLRSKGKLTARSSVDKTFVGSVTAYYDKDSLVLISSLTDAETAGTETLYFLQRGVLTKAFVMESTFDSRDEWTEYFSSTKQLTSVTRVTERRIASSPRLLSEINRQLCEPIVSG